MPLANLHTLTPDDYVARRRALLQQLEGFGATPYFDSVGLVTIGVGFNIDVQNLAVRSLVYQTMGYSPVERLIMNAAFDAPRMAEIRAMPNGADKNQALQTYLDGVVTRRAFSMTPAEVDAAFLSVVTPHQTAINQLIATPRRVSR